MKENIEVEFRGPLSKDQYLKLVEKFSKEGNSLEEKKRIFVDYSTFLEGEGIKERQRDIRIRNTNGKSEIMIKLGGWGGSEHREELSAFTDSSFDTLARIFHALGYSKGVLCVRHTRAYMYNNIEFALVEVPGHSYYYEAERMVASDKDMQQVKDEIAEVCSNLGLTVFDADGWFKYVDILNSEANGVFDYSTHPADFFKEKFGI